ncbi:hypothetical protein PPSIR1_36107 [Plesiocystis pacifica SIR-1]|uniref:Amine oxidase domain-containing protein n=1 Tax=Plesiocystis pacifica SIR-1 TaxID=391625 RepID=A6G200_9BACT|nr:FAD-dependent oxidoreductase [Plesiocystis pacifica]EDM80190.1 hypothetical protein PPSIR1_36107 [Plesiocystis pacifica SIR-1]
MASEARKGLVARWIERRFGGYRHPVNSPDPELPAALESPKRVAVIGAGLAGLGAAAKLAERGFGVVLFERNHYLGGKLGAWKTTFPDGSEEAMNHGFHAFFRHYYNLSEFLSQLGIDRNLTEVGDYMILGVDGQRYSFAGAAATPLLNLISLGRLGLYSFREVTGRKTRTKLEALLRYDRDKTYAEWDSVSFAEFAEQAELPDSLALVFNTFSRAFFSDAEKMSMAELMKSFHYYYLSNDNGLLYDHLDDDFEPTLLTPLREYLERHGVDIRLETEVGAISANSASTEGASFTVDDEPFDYLLIASDVVGTRSIFAASPELAAAAPETAAKIDALFPGQRYSVWRLWLDIDFDRGEVPSFVITERDRYLDAISWVEGVESSAAEWVAERRKAGKRGCVLELHCYAVPEELSGGRIDAETEEVIREGFLVELRNLFPELADAPVIHDELYVRRDFPAFHVGTHAQRPGIGTDHPRLFLAGDWVDLPFPAMLMEAAYTSGLMAANAMMSAEGLREEPVWSVPKRGILA